MCSHLFVAPSGRGGEPAVGHVSEGCDGGGLWWHPDGAGDAQHIARWSRARLSTQHRQPTLQGGAYIVLLSKTIQLSNVKKMLPFYSRGILFKFFVIMQF